MSRKTIIRTITATTIKSANMGFVKGLPVVTENKDIVVNGTIEESKALKEIRKTYGENAQIVEITAIDAVYEITVEDFIKYATKVEPTVEEKAEPIDEEKADTIVK
jgi:hypothetical protein